jgi:hypothetical protein
MVHLLDIKFTLLLVVFFIKLSINHNKKISMIKSISLKILIVVVTIYDLEIQMDVKIAFSHGLLVENSYVLVTWF